jgi:hypothetical protein
LGSCWLCSGRKGAASISRGSRGVGWLLARPFEREEGQR